MLVFPNAKINIGLRILNKREDGYHNIETVFYPVGLSDILEFVVSDFGTRLNLTGLNYQIPEEDNIVMKAWQMLDQHYRLPDVNIFLHKIIPTGAGLGGGSSDAAFVLKAANDYFNLKMSETELMKFSSALGSDCPFFILNKPVFAEGTGTIFSPIELDLSPYRLVVVKPNIHVPTKLAYQNVRPGIPETSLKLLITLPVSEWKNFIVNDFEYSIFKAYPKIESIKNALYECGALYAQMSGSGSSVFGIFDKKTSLPDTFKPYFIYEQ